MDVLIYAFGDSLTKESYCKILPVPGEPGTDGVASKGGGVLTPYTTIFMILNRDVSTPILVGGHRTYLLITGAVDILFTHFLCRLSSYRSGSSTISSEITFYQEREYRGVAGRRMRQTSIISETKWVLVRQNPLGG